VPFQDHPLPKKTGGSCNIHPITDGIPKDVGEGAENYFGMPWVILGLFLKTYWRVIPSYLSDLR
jgi:hypothetical protein